MHDGPGVSGRTATADSHVAADPGIVPRLRTWVFGIRPDDVTIAKRGFHRGNGAHAQRVEAIGEAFKAGFNGMLAARRVSDIAHVYDAMEPFRRGFTAEGSAMAAQLLDRLRQPIGRPRNPHWNDLLHGVGAPYFYMIYVGAGWVWARMPVDLTAARRSLHPLFGWLGLDGYGFHHGFFGFRRSVLQHRVPGRLDAEEVGAFDQGLGRSLWFVHGGDAERITHSIHGFASERQPHLWSGVGLAATYAGPAHDSTLTYIREASERHWPSVAQGSAFAAKTRLVAGNIAADNEIACRVLTGMEPEVAAEITDRELPRDVDSVGDGDYEAWRCRIQAHFKA